jgi:hypothetical protein
MQARRSLALAFAGLLLAAPAAHARTDEGGGAAVPGPAPLRAAEPDGFSWAAAGIGAGAAFGAVLVAGGAGRVVRSHLQPARS